MSYSNKPEEFDVYDYATRSQEPPSYAAALAQPSTYASQYNTQLPDSHAPPSIGQMPYLSDPIAARDPYQDPFIAAGPRHATEVISYTPLKASPGSRLRIQIKTVHELTAQRGAVVMFGPTKAVNAIATKTGQDGQYQNYTLEADIPSLESTAWSDSQVVPLMVKLDGDLGVIPCGTFQFTQSYAESPNYPYGSGSLQSLQRKRKASSTESGDLLGEPAKRVASGVYEPQRDISGVYSNFAVSGPPASPYLQAGVGYALPTGAYDTRPMQPSYYQTPKMGYQYPPITGAPRPTIKAQSPRYGYSTVRQMTRSPAISAAPAVSRTASMPGGPVSTPTLIRTSTMQPSAPPSVSATTVQNFNPYSMYPNSKAILKIEGDLDTMIDNWTEEEYESKRRLVLFHRSQTGNTINATFQPVAPKDLPTKPIVVSCIWWEEENEHFVTSVDTISLLESLVSVRFTVEEKNRIRRNLEGFQPKTVSKAKPESEEFFKLIMGFPNPKPRNIEKDVKVFKWKILSHALNKIIGKYSASYSSTAAVLTPGTSGYTSGGPSEASERRPTASPRSVTSSAASTAYRGGMTSTALSPHMPSAGLDLATGAPPPNLRVSMPQLSASNYGEWSAGQPYYGPSLQATGRSSWDYSSYVHADTGAGAAVAATGTPAPTAQSAGGYQQGVGEGAVPGTGTGALRGDLPTESPYAPYGSGVGQRTSRA